MKDHIFELRQKKDQDMITHPSYTKLKKLWKKIPAST